MSDYLAVPVLVAVVRPAAATSSSAPDRTRMFALAHRSCFGQCGWNRQPAGRSVGSGTSIWRIGNSALSSSSSNRFGVVPSSAHVYGGEELYNISSIPAVSTISKASMTEIRSKILVSSGRSCVMNTRVRSYVSCKSCSNETIERCMSKSNAAVGSSLTNTSGSRIRLSSMSARCFIPPESSCGYASSTRSGSRIDPNALVVGVPSGPSVDARVLAVLDEDSVNFSLLDIDVLDCETMTARDTEDAPRSASYGNVLDGNVRASSIGNTESGIPATGIWIDCINCFDSRTRCIVQEQPAATGVLVRPSLMSIPSTPCVSTAWCEHSSTYA